MFRRRLTALLPQRSLITRLTLSIGLLALSTMIIESVVLVWTAHVQLETLTSQRLDDEADQFAALLNRSMFERSSELEMFATLDQLRDPDGLLASKRTLLEQLQRSHLDYAWIGFADPSGRILVGTAGQFVGEDVSTLPWFQGGLRGSYVGDVPAALPIAKQLPNAGDEAPYFAELAVPILDDAGQVQGVLGAYLGWQWASELQQLFQATPRDATQPEAVVVSANNVIVVGPAALLRQRLELPSIVAARAGTVGVLQERWPDGIAYLTAFRASAGHRDVASLGWVVLVRQPTTSAFELIMQTELPILLGNLMLVALLAGVAWLIGRQILAPLHRIALAADRVHQNGAPIDIPLLPGEDELAGLARSLRALVQTLSSSERALLGANMQLQHELGQRQRAEAANYQSEERFRMLTEGVEDYAIYLLDKWGNIISWNAGAARIKGYNSDEIIGRSFAIFYLPSDLKEGKPLQALEAAARLGRHEDEGERVRKDGTRFWANVVITALHNDQGRLRGFIKITRDVTARRQDQAKLLASQARLEAIVVSAMDAIISTNEQQQIVLFNPAAEQLFGYQAALILGQPLDCLLPERYRQIHRSHISMFGAGGETNRSVHASEQRMALRANGEEFPIESSISQIKVDGEQLYTVVLRDIGARIRLEAQLRQAQKLETVGRLAGGIAHDFNNLLTVISGSVELAASALEPSSPAQPDLEAIQDAAMRGSTLTRQLLAFARQQVMTPQQLHLGTLVTNLRGLLQRLLGSTMRLQIRVAPALGTVLADPGQLEQVLVNMAVNARDAMTTGGTLLIELNNVELSAETLDGAELAPGAYLRLAVSDTGEGMSPAVQAHIFEPFFTTKSPDQGSGLGLATCYGIIAQHRGRIVCTSAPGQGTTFTIYLPRSAE